jgi:PTH2 family peptidyl-tRNA hydrolase
MSDIKQVLVCRTDLNMRKGKLCSQSAHSAMMFIAKQFRNGTAIEIATQNKTSNMKTFAITVTEEQLQWLQGQFTKIVVGVNSELELMQTIDKAIAEGLTANYVVDSGKTEFAGVPTLTCAAIGPNEVECVNKITGNLKLL